MPEGVIDAVDFIAALRQAPDKTAVPVGRNVLVIGGGMTAIDAATQAKLLGAECVTIAYRRGKVDMPASPYEQDVAQVRGVLIRENLMPVAVESQNGRSSGVTFEHTRSEGGRLAGTGERITLAADQVLTAIGQMLKTADLSGAGLVFEKGRVAVDGDRRTSLAGVWAGGDCIAEGSDLTVVAVADGKKAAASTSSALQAAASPFAQERKPWRTFASLRRHPIAATLLARLGAAHRQGLQRRARLQGRLGRRGVEDPGRGPADRQCQWSALRRVLRRRPRVIGFNNIELITDRPLDSQPAGDHAGQARLARPRLVVSLMVPCEEELEGDHQARRGDRRRRHRAQFRLPARHERTRHGLGGRPGARIHRDGDALVQAHRRMPVIVKLTPNVTGILPPAARRSVAAPTPCR